MPNNLRTVSSIQDAALQAERGKSLYERYYKPYRYFPLVVVSKGLMIAWIYTMIPLNNYWVYYLIKSPLWCIVALISYIETLSFSLPDVPDSLYIFAYVGGAILSPAIHTALYFASEPNNYWAATFAVVAGFIWTALVFAIHALPHPKLNYQLKADRRDSSMYPRDWAATYAAIVRRDEDEDFKLSIAVYGAPAPSHLAQSLSKPSTITRQPQFKGPNTADQPPYQYPDRYEYNLDDDEDAFKGQNETVLDLVPLYLDKFFKAKHFWFLPRFWNHQYHIANSTLRPDANRRYLWLFAVTFVAMCCLDYTFLCFFTATFQKSDQRARIGLFFIYIAVTTTFRFIFKSLGMSLDRKKNVTVSIFFVGEVYGLMFYYTFYRVLFESIKSIPEFTIFQVIHLASEWILYVMRATKWYYDLTEAIGQKYFSRFLARQRLPHKHWQRFMALDFGIRCTVFIVTAVGIMQLIATVQLFPYLRGTNDLEEDAGSFKLTLLFISVALILELINAFLINLLYFDRLGLGVREETIHCFALRDFSLLATVNCAALFINPIYAFTTVSFAKK